MRRRLVPHWAYTGFEPAGGGLERAWNRLATASMVRGGLALGHDGLELTHDGVEPAPGGGHFPSSPPDSATWPSTMPHRVQWAAGRIIRLAIRVALRALVGANRGSSRARRTARVRLCLCLCLCLVSLIKSPLDPFSDHSLFPLPSPHPPHRQHPSPWTSLPCHRLQTSSSGKAMQDPSPPSSPSSSPCQLRSSPYASMCAPSCASRSAAMTMP